MLITATDKANICVWSNELQYHNDAGGKYSLDGFGIIGCFVFENYHPFEGAPVHKVLKVNIFFV